MKHQIGVASPTRQERPVEFHPPPSLPGCQHNTFLSQSDVSNILEFGEDLRCWRMIGHDPERKQEGEESEDMCEQDDSFC